MGSIERLPAYHRLYVVLAERIRIGEYRVGAALPSEADLTEEHGVSRVTVRRALDQLVSEGLIEKQQGRGSFVAHLDLKSDKPPALSGVITNLVAGGDVLKVETLQWARTNAPQHAATALGLESQAECLLITRVRRHGDSPISVTSIYIPAQIGDRLDEAKSEQSLILEQLADAGFEPLHTIHRLSATLASGETSARLQVRTGSPLLRMRGVVYGEADKALYYQESVFHPDNYEYAIRLDRDENETSVQWQVAGPD